MEGHLYDAGPVLLLSAADAADGVVCQPPALAVSCRQCEQALRGQDMM
jgi:hypothetical protein